MATPDVLDFDRLLSPISEEAPAGVALKDDPAGSRAYYEIRDAREAARTAERQQLVATLDGDSAAAVPAPDWKRVKELSIKALAESTKDLWLVAWLIEALVRLHGFAGVRDGYRLTRELVERYWDEIHPRPDEDGVVTTVAQLTGLNGDNAEGALLVPLANIPLVEFDGAPLTSADYIDASDMEQTTDPERRARRIDQGAVSLQDFERAAANTPVEELRNRYEDIEQALKEFETLTQLLDERCGKGSDGYSLAPPSSSVRNALIECKDRLRSLAGTALGVEEEEAEQSKMLATTGGNHSPPSIDARVATREDALRALLQVADYFRRTEPHSPVSYALEQAVRWGRMSLPELMSELISNESAREELFRRTGMRPPEE
jgi:type VI secretion system protein ImpA